MSLEGRVALVTGASGGIGEAIARTLAQRGMRVVVNSRSERAERVAETLRGENLTATALRADVTNQNAVAELFARIENEIGPLWVLVNNAGVLHRAPIMEMSEEAWDDAMNGDLKSVFLCSQAAVRYMLPRRAGRIVNIGSIAGVIARPNQVGYSSAKAGVAHFTRCLALEVAPSGITVNCVAPGMTETEMTRSNPTLDLDALWKLIPTGRLSEPQDTAQLVAYFASEEAAQIIGQVVCVDGGQSLNVPLPARKH